LSIDGRSGEREEISLATLVTILQIICALGLVVLLAVQTDKSEQGGVMGIGGAGGRSSGEIDMEVGAERILKPLTRWVANAFLATSILSAIPRDIINVGHVVGVFVAYLIIMLYGGTIWRVFFGAR
jgi:protein translocase SecG subunit